MKRRAFLTASVTGLTALAGCTGGGLGGLVGGQSNDGGTNASLPNVTNGPTQNSSLPNDSDGDDGRPPEFEDQPARQEIDENAFETKSVPAGQIRNASSSVTVTLAPIDVVYYWYTRGDARFADARGEFAYEQAHVYGAVSSPAGAQIAAPVADWPTDARVVTYCGCPHHLSSIRAAELQGHGFENVYVIDEGFGEWRDRSYPMDGTEVDRRPPRFTVRGTVDASHAGEAVWVRHAATGQREVSAITEAGEYEVEFGFYEVTSGTTVRLETPEYAFEAPVEELTADPVTAADAR